MRVCARARAVPRDGFVRERTMGVKRVADGDCQRLRLLWVTGLVAEVVGVNVGWKIWQISAVVREIGSVRGRYVMLVLWYWIGVMRSSLCARY